MKTVSYSRNGPADSVLEFVDQPVPVPGDGEVLVKLYTSGVNPSDVKTRAGRPLAFKYVIPHSDGAGIIEQVGKNVDTSKIGSRVWIWNGQWQRQCGTAAEYIAVPEHQAVALDASVTFEEGACLGIPGLTAAHAVNLANQFGSERLLVTGAGSVVGHLITQMAVANGHTVYGTASQAKHQTAVNAGAVDCIDYQTEDVGERLLELTDGYGVDMIIDMDFASTKRLIASSALCPNGTVVSYGSNDMGDLEVSFRDLLFKSITLQFFLVYELSEGSRDQAIKSLESFIKSEKHDFGVSHVLPLEEAVKAHQLVESGEANGNVVLAI